MAQMPSSFKIRLRPGVVVQGVLELLKLADEAMELVPDWCPEKAELDEKINELCQMLPHHIKLETE